MSEVSPLLSKILITNFICNARIGPSSTFMKHTVHMNMSMLCVHCEPGLIVLRAGDREKQQLYVRPLAILSPHSLHLNPNHQNHYFPVTFSNKKNLRINLN